MSVDKLKQCKKGLHTVPEKGVRVVNYVGTEKVVKYLLYCEVCNKRIKQDDQGNPIIKKIPIYKRALLYLEQHGFSLGALWILII
ncbi:hypothetical protein SAMN04488137_1610 [Fictibacillus solisalsi]|uniref:Uncharacterized protein n=1 Tax=Fictibacillus solisalsi TaxID=459525 RepID=A0A1G9VIR4_9BACL|nr:hypothetical protein [Fictibacillus solisalsi]SDM72000.1 hypothetical protein SAMN04488137_1610 [Fictibacillus solisalsi]